MIRTYKFRLYPTVKQTARLNEVCKLQAEIYNAGLENRKEAYKRGKVSVSYYDQQKEFTEVRKLREDIGQFDCQMMRYPLRQLDRAFNAFFRRCKLGQTPGFPRWKSGHRWSTLTFPRSVKLRNNGKVYLPSLGEFIVKWSRKLPEEAAIAEVNVTRSGSKWYICFILKNVNPRRDFQKTTESVGVDLGITKLAALSDGAFIENPQFLKKEQENLKTIQRQLSRCKRGSNRRKKVVQKLSKKHEKIRNQRKDFLHKQALTLVQNFDTIVVEDLKIKNMVHKPKPKKDEEGIYVANGAAAKAGLNKSISDAGWGMLLQLLDEKAEEAARTVIRVNPAYTSQQCSECLYLSSENRELQSKFVCKSCGYIDNADTNASKNILRVGLIQHTKV